MGIYDFNMPKNNIDTVIEKLREELRTIMASSQSNINELARRIASDEKLLNELRNLVNDLPDYTAQYEELKSELRQVKDQLQNLADHPIDLGTIDIQTPGGLVAEVQKINGQYLYADRSIKDISGRPIIDTYATKDELGQDTVSILNNLSTVSGILNTAIANERDERVAAITAEATEREYEDFVLKELIKTEREERDAAIADEVSARESADSVLSGLIETERYERILSDQALQEMIHEAGIEVDSALDPESRNPVENRVVNAAFDGVGNELDTKQNLLTEMTDDEINDLIESLEDL